MCGILAVLGCSDDSQTKRARVLELSRRLKHRGPDWSGLYQHGDCYLAHQRLAIVDPNSGDQPLFNEDKSVAVTYEEYGEDFVDMLDGIFSFVLLDARDNSFIVARDAIGITSLYIGWGLDGSIWVSSELKGLNDACEQFESFPPGHMYTSKSRGLRRWYNPLWFSDSIPSVPYDPFVLRHALENAVIKRLMTDFPFGVLLSGGLDSSLITSITARYLAATKAAKHGGKLHSFCIGLEGSPDLKAAREAADYLGTVHHEFHFTVQDGIDAIEDVIYHIETYDVTTIRASTPMFLMARKIKSLGVKMLISGEGADEVFGGYLYFHKAPNKEEFHRETCRKIKALHQYDCLRANKATSAWGLEVRVPFLDKEFLNVAMSIDPKSKMIKKDEGRIEKWVLRKAFDDEECPYLPKVSDKMMVNASCIFPHNTPKTKEAYYYRMIFERFFPQNSARLTVPGGASVACSTAKAVEWDVAWKNNLDPSGRAALGVHLSAYAMCKSPVL
ncbi:hypothetical protein ES319_A05G091200v1 [Gossypium barbadense]|uniref:Asparagine synthetase [glutamine-hydrolyzing] n=1 Tax=Gossypium barbadense TaxID=3634 RepID=A0A5J5VMI1_GOSBA|nr:hypothetical protein ES319_A05G091200v1 [Gossypium barbadense]